MRGIRFYEVHTSSVHVGRLVVLQLEPSNIYDSNWVAVQDILGHLVREDAAFLALLLWSLSKTPKISAYLGLIM